MQPTYLLPALIFSSPKRLAGLYLRFFIADVQSKIISSQEADRNSFGILACTFRLFLRHIDLEPGKVELVTLAAYCLHNLIRSVSLPSQGFNLQMDNLGESVVRGQGMGPIERRGRHAQSTTPLIRDNFRDYLTEVAPLPFPVGQ